MHHRWIQPDAPQVVTVTIQVPYRGLHPKGQSIINHKQPTDYQDSIRHENVGQRVIEAVVPIDKGEIEPTPGFLELRNRKYGCFLHEFNTLGELQSRQ